MQERQRQEQIEMLIRFYNMQAGTSFRVGKYENQCAVNSAIERASGDIVKVKNAVREWVNHHTDVATASGAVITCFDAILFDEAEKAEPEETPTPEQTEEKSESKVAGAIDFLQGVVIDLIAKTNAEQITAAVTKRAEDEIREFIKREYGTIERKVVTVVDGKKFEGDGVVHEKFEQIVKFVANNEPVFLTGPAGSGKNVLCQQVAKALGLNFYFSNAVTQEYKITGFTDAMGIFHESQFYKAFKNGGLFMLDEMDASIPEVLVILNAAIANRYFDFPAPIGYVEAHPDFRVIAAGNTFGLGANYEYVGRNQLDMASLDRFAVVKVDYDKGIEMNVAQGNAELVDFADDVRKAAEKSGIRFIVSYRAIGRIAKLESLLGIEEALQTCLIKSLEKDDINALLSNVAVNNKYVTAVRRIRERA